MTPERRAIAFLLLLMGLSVAARFLDRPRVQFPDAAPLDLAAHEAAVREAVAASIRRPLAEGESIDPNTATARELERLPRVGPSLAARIVEARDAAPFVSVADLQRRVAGVGPALAGSLAPHLRLPAESASPGATPGEAQRAGVSSPGSGLPALPVAINRATAEELVALPGVGPVLASRIVAYRDSAGPFRSEAELERVPGIGPALRQRLAPLVRFAP